MVTVAKRTTRADDGHVGAVAGTGDTLKLDGGDSSDSDTGTSSGLGYSWACARGGLAFGRACGVALASTSAVSLTGVGAGEGG
jgi:hypothetical protein